jgi:O-antigen/teichoic acid export membrane protein
MTDARGDAAGLRTAISSAFAGLLVVAAGTLAAGCALAWLVQPSWVGLQGDGLRSELRWTVLAVALALAVTIPSLVGSRVQHGLQEGYKSAVWIGAGGLVQLGGVLLCGALHLSLAWFVLAFAGGPAVANLANAVTVFSGARADLRPSLALASWSVIRRLGRVGGLFFVLGIVGAAAYESDALIIAQRVGSVAVAQYSVAYRLFTVVPLAVGTFVASLWPAYGEAMERGDVHWIQRAYRRSIRLSLMINGLAGLSLVVLARPLISAWAGDTVLPSHLLIASLAAYAIANSWSGPMAMLLNGTGVVGFQVRCALTMLVANLGLSWVLAGHVGAAGPVLGTVISQVACILLPSWLFIRRHLAQLVDAA